METTLFPEIESLLHRDYPAVASGLVGLATAIDLLAVIVMVVGVLRFAIGFLRGELAGAERGLRIDGARRDLGRYILAGLEVLIVSDIIHTAVSLRLSDLLFLGLLVLIRSVISFFLEREIAGLREDAH